MKTVITYFLVIYSSAITLLLLSSMSNNEKHSSPLVLSDLYVLRSTGCERIAHGCVAINAAFSTINTGSQAAIRSTSGQPRTLWEDSWCLIAPVYMM